MKSSTVAFESRRLAMAPIAREDAQALFPIMSDARVSTYLTWAPHRDVGETSRLIESLIAATDDGRGYHWTIREGEHVRGLISLIDVRRTHRLWTLDRAEISYLVDPNYQGRGFATEATAAVLQPAFEVLHLNKLIISHTTANAASGKIPQRLGFRFVGTEYQFFNKHGVWYDMNHYELLAQDWLARREKES